MIHAKHEAPFDISIKNHSLTYDPLSGNYLVLRRNQRQLYEYQPDRDEWRLAMDWSKSGWPFGAYGFEVPIVIDDLGVILWQYAPGPLLYRHRSVFGPDSAEKTSQSRHDPAAEPLDRTIEGAVSTPGGLAAGPVAQEARPQATAESVPAPRRVAAREPHLPPPSVIVNEPVSSVAAPSEARAPRSDVAPHPHPAAVRRDETLRPDAAQAAIRAGPPYTAPRLSPPAMLAKIIASMKPGEWRAIETKLPAGQSTLYSTLSIEFCPLGQGKGTHGNGWMDAFVYDPVSRSFFVLLMRDSSEKRVAWLDADLAWHYVRNPPGIDTCSFNRRTFNRLTLVDGMLYWLPAHWGAKRVEVGKFVRAPVADFVANGTATFTEYGVGIGITSMGQAGDYAVEWFPEIGAWILHLPGKDTASADAGAWSAPSGHTAEGLAEKKLFMGRLFLFRPGDAKWTYLDRTYSQGFRSRILYNPIRGELLVAPGGYGPDDAFTRITASGEIIKLDGARIDSGEPLHYHTGKNDLTYDPVSGDYLCWSYNDQRIWRSRDGVRWTTYEDFHDIKFHGPGGLFGASSFIQVNPVPGTDGLIWFDPYRGVILHRMRHEAPTIESATK